MCLFWCVVVLFCVCLCVVVVFVLFVIVCFWGVLFCFSQLIVGAIDIKEMLPNAS